MIKTNSSYSPNKKPDWIERRLVLNFWNFFMSHLIPPHPFPFPALLHCGRCHLRLPDHWLSCWTSLQHDWLRIPGISIRDRHPHRTKRLVS
jgi:hypothetical protein